MNIINLYQTRIDNTVVMHINFNRLNNRFLLLTLLIGTFMIHSQEEKVDKVYLKDKRLIQGKVLQVTPSGIEIDPIGEKPFLIIDRKNAVLIVYADNTTVQLQSANNDINNEKIDVFPKNETKNSDSKYFPLVESNIYSTARKLLKENSEEFNDLKIDEDYFIPSEEKVIVNQAKENNAHQPIKSIEKKYEKRWNFSPNGNLTQIDYYSSEKRSYDHKRPKKFTYDEYGRILSISTGIFYKYAKDTTFIEERSKSGRLESVKIIYKNIMVRAVSIPRLKIQRISYFILKPKAGGLRIEGTYIYGNGKKVQPIVTMNYEQGKLTYYVWSDDSFKNEIFYEKDGKIKNINDLKTTRKERKENTRFLYNKKGLISRIKKFNWQTGVDYSPYFNYEFY